jgi:hypothetical protein
MDPDRSRETLVGTHCRNYSDPGSTPRFGVVRSSLIFDTSLKTKCLCGKIEHQGSCGVASERMWKVDFGPRAILGHGRQERGASPISTRRTSGVPVALHGLGSKLIHFFKDGQYLGKRHGIEGKAGERNLGASCSVGRCALSRCSEVHVSPNLSRVKVPARRQISLVSLVATFPGGHPPKSGFQFVRAPFLPSSGAFLSGNDREIS